MRFQPVPMPGPLRRGANGGPRARDATDFRHVFGAPAKDQAKDQAAESSSDPERGAGLRNKRRARGLAGFGRLWMRYFPFPLLLSLALAFFVVLAVCWSLWAP